jgi:hypothetical protein
VTGGVFFALSSDVIEHSIAASEPAADACVFECECNAKMKEAP